MLKINFNPPSHLPMLKTSAGRQGFCGLGSIISINNMLVRKFHFKPETKSLLLKIIRDLFLGLYFLMAVFSAMEAIKPRIVTNYISLDLFFLALLIFGIITIIYYQPREKEIKKLKILDYMAIILFSILLGIFTAYLSRQIGFLAILVGMAAVIISYYFITLCCKE